MKFPARSWVRWLLAGLALLVLAVMAAALWLVATEAGLRHAVALASSVGTVEIRLTGARGRLMGPLHIDAIEIEHPRASIRATGFEADYEPLEILAGRISAEGARIASARIELRPPAGPPQPPSFMPAWLSLVLDDAAVTELVLVSPAGTETRFADIRGSAQVSRTRVGFEDAQVRGAGWAVEAASGALYAREPLALEVETGWSLTGETPFNGTARAAGDFDRLLVDARVDVPAVARVKAELSDVSSAIRWRASPR